MKTYEVLSLLSKAVLSMHDVNNGIDACDLHGNTIQSAKTLLHKCVSQFAKRQQIHAQQAARYLRGHNDVITSHTTVPMLSGLLIHYISEECKSISGSMDNRSIGQSCCESEKDNDLVNGLPVKQHKFGEANTVHILDPKGPEEEDCESHRLIVNMSNKGHSVTNNAGS